MSPPLCKKPRENNVQTATKAEEDSVSDSDSNQESLSGEEEEEMLYMTFCGHQPTEEHIDGVSRLLRSTFHGVRLDFKELAKLISEQEKLSTVLIQEQESDESNDSDDNSMQTGNNTVIFGVCSLLDFNKLNAAPCISIIHKHIWAKLNEKRNSIPSLVIKKFIEVLGDDNMTKSKKSMPSVGFIINERFVNLPPQGSLRMFENLQTEMKTAACKFDFFLMIINMLAATGTKTYQNFKFTNFYMKAEEELIDEKAKWSFVYNVDDPGDDLLQESGVEDVAQQRKVVLFESSLFPDILKKMQDTLKKEEVNE